jgi:hypothetical protein
VILIGYAALILFLVSKLNSTTDIELNVVSRHAGTGRIFYQLELPYEKLRGKQAVMLEVIWEPDNLSDWEIDLQGTNPIKGTKNLFDVPRLIDNGGGYEFMMVANSLKPMTMEQIDRAMMSPMRVVARFYRNRDYRILLEKHEADEIH